MKHHLRTTVLPFILTAGLFAQNENQLPVYELKDIIVTGELWKSELHESTASISVLGEDALVNNGNQHFEDVINSIPNLTWTGGTSRPRYLQIRGIGENSQFEGETPDSSVRFLMDDFDLTGLGTVGNLFDAQQVEVLRGPQAGAFGANAAGGVVKIVSNEPTPYWTGQSEATVGNDELYALGLALGGPLIESDPDILTFRFSINSLNQNGFRKNQFLDREDTNAREEKTGRLKLRWLPNHNWSLETGLLYAEADNGYDVFTLSNERTDTFSDEPGRDLQETRGGSLRATYHGFDDFELTSISQLTDSDSTYSYDADWADPTTDGNYDGFLETNRQRDVFSQELRLDSQLASNAAGWIDRWTAGSFFHTLEEDTDVLYTEFGATSATYESRYKTHTSALFGQAAHDFSNRTRLIVGLRAEHHEVDVSSSGTYYGSPVGGESKQSEILWGGKLTLEQDLNSAHSVFASAARGYKAGGANVASFTEPGDPLTYDNETLYNFEIGLRSRLLEGKLVTQMTAFYLYRQNAQLRDSEGAGGFFRYLTVNGESAEHLGLETEATWYLNDSLTLSGGLGLLETSRESYQDPGGPVASRDLANAPSFTYHLRISYEKEQGLFANAELLGRDEYFESNSHRQKRNAFALVNAAIGYRFKNWTITLWSKNLFDQTYEDRVFNFGNRFDTSTPDPFDFEAPQRYEAPAAPPTYGLTLNYQW